MTAVEIIEEQRRQVEIASENEREWWELAMKFMGTGNIPDNIKESMANAHRMYEERFEKYIKMRQSRDFGELHRIYCGLQ